MEYEYIMPFKQEDEQPRPYTIEEVALKGLRASVEAGYFSEHEALRQHMMFFPDSYPVINPEVIPRPEEQ